MGARSGPRSIGQFKNRNSGYVSRPRFDVPIVEIYIDVGGLVATMWWGPRRIVLPVEGLLGPVRAHVCEMIRKMVLAWARIPPPRPRIRSRRLGPASVDGVPGVVYGLDGLRGAWASALVRVEEEAKRMSTVRVFIQ